MHPLWTTLLKQAKVPHDAAMLGRLERYLELLIEANATINLTRITDPTDAAVKHVADALTLLPYIPQKTSKLADVGTGGGIPGVILSIARPDVRVTLIDATAKKLAAVAQMTQTLGLTNVKTLHQRAENVQQTFDVITLRAVGRLEVVVPWCLGMMKPTTRLLLMKGPKAREELGAAHKLLSREGLKNTIYPVEAPELAGHVIVKLSGEAK